MNKEKYLEPRSAEIEFDGTAALCQASGTESFNTDDGLVYPIDIWE